MTMREKKFTDFYQAWWFLEAHPIFQRKMSAGFQTPDFQGALDIHVARVDPKTHIIDFNDDAKNTLTQVWLECGPWEDAEDFLPKGEVGTSGFMGAFTHDINLDCGGDTFEKAIVELANLVVKHYGEGKEPL